MPLDNAKNFAKVTVSTVYNSSDTSIVLTTGHGTKLPTAPFNVVWWNSTDYGDPSDDPNVEIVRVTNVSTDTLTVTRAQEGTTASTKNTASKTYKMIAGLTAKVINTDLMPLSFANANRDSDSTTWLYTDDIDYIPTFSNGNTTINMLGGTARYQSRLTTSDWAAADQPWGLIKLGDYLYVLLQDTGATPDEWRIYRYGKDSLSAGGTLMTFSGTLPDLTTDSGLRITSDGTYIYINYNGGNSANAYVLAKYSISGTVLTYVSSITCGSATLGFHQSFAVLSTGNIYTLDETNAAISKFNSSGTNQYTDSANSLSTTLTRICNIRDTLYGFNNSTKMFVKLTYT